MKDKYYTPTIEEFHVGFEFETRYLEKDWVKKKLTFDDFGFYTSTWDVDSTPETEFRVKYLDKEDIESLGFKLIENKSEYINNYQNLKDSFLRLYCFYTKGVPYVSVYHYGGWETPDLIIKNKSELKKLLTQLNII